jgi:hypothetical protein
LPGVLDPDEHVVVAREHDETAEGHLVEALGSAEDAQDDLVQLAAGPEQRPAMNGAVGDLEEGSALRDVAYFSSHAQMDGKNRRRRSNFFRGVEEGGRARGRRAIPR